jgi:peroxiredoxin
MVSATPPGTKPSARSRPIGKFLALLAAYLLLSGTVHAGVVRVGESAPDFSLPELSGPAVSLAGKKGDVVLLYFWAQCAVCQRQLPALEGLYGKHRKRGFSILAVNVGQKPMIVEFYAKQSSLTFPVLVDEKMKVSGRYGVTRVPTVFLLDRQGVVREKVLGEIEPEKLEKMILAALAR